MNYCCNVSFKNFSVHCETSVENKYFKVVSPNFCISPNSEIKNLKISLFPAAAHREPINSSSPKKNPRRVSGETRGN